MLRSADLSRALAENDHQSIADRVVTEFDSRLGSLSEEQIQTMRLICAGMLNKEIAKNHSVCTRTIEARRSRIMEVLEVSSAAELGFVVGVAEAFRLISGQRNDDL